MPGERTAIYLLIGLGAAIAAWIGRTIPRVRARRAANKRLEDGLAKLADGEPATVIGTVRAAGKTLEAPLSGKTCVAYEARGRTRIGVGRYTETTPDVVKTELVPFDLETSRGLVRVEGTTAELAFPVEPLIPRKVEREATFAQSVGIEAAMRDASFEEICVEPGAKVAVHGVVTIEVAAAGGETGFRDTNQQLRITAHPDHPLTIGAVR